MALSGPFIIKLNTAYMEVPFCRTCRFWRNTQNDAEGRRQCWLPMEPNAKMVGGMDETLTAPDFGCVQHEPRGTGDEDTGCTCYHGRGSE